MKIQAILIEDDLDLAKTIVQYLSLDDIDCDFASDGQSGYNLALENPYHVILLDVNLPKVNGLNVCSKLREQGVDTPILMLTAKDTIEDKLTGFKAGTDDYLIKPFDMSELIARIQALAKRKSTQALKYKVGDLEMDLFNKTVQRQATNIELTPIEWKLLKVLISESPRVMSKEELEFAVWHDELPDTSALKVHLFRLRQKVDKPFSTALIHTINKRGFVLKSHEEE